MRRPPRVLSAVLTLTTALSVGAMAVPSASNAATIAKHPSRAAQSRAAEAFDVVSLHQAAAAVEAEALASHALHRPPPYKTAAKILLASVEALTKKARREDPTLAPTDTRAVMGAVPTVISHHKKHPRHRHISATHTLLRFGHRIPDYGSAGIGTKKKHAGNQAALFQQPDGHFVQPHLQVLSHPTVGLVALRTAMKSLGQPYVWGAAGPYTFDCSGLVQWAYAHAGVSLGHYTGWQWNEGRLIPGRDILPGDLILFGHSIYHVGMYLGAGWMINAPYTGQYVNVAPVYDDVAGVIRP